MPALNPEKKSKSTTPFCLKCLQKRLSPHETSLIYLKCLQKKKKSPHAAKKKRGDNSAKKTKSTRDKSNLPAELPPLPFFAPCGNVTKVTPPPFPSLLSSGGRPRLPSTEGNLGQPSQFALHRGQTGTKSSQIALQKGNLGRFWPEEGILGRFRRASQGALPYYFCERGNNAFAKSIDPCQPAQSDMGQNVSLCFIFLHIEG